MCNEKFMKNSRKWRDQKIGESFYVENTSNIWFLNYAWNMLHEHAKISIQSDSKRKKIIFQSVFINTCFLFDQICTFYFAN